MRKTHKIAQIFLVAGSCVACDQASKAASLSYLQSSPPISIMEGFIRLQFVQNTGIFLSFGADMSPDVRFWLFTVFVGLMLTGLLLYTVFSRRMNSLVVTGASLVAGGGLSNLIDRLVHAGAVIDIMDVTVGNYRSGIFNLADVAITLGSMILFFHLITRGKRRKVTELNDLTYKVTRP